jgi:ABC-type dipeptide/oligopeptide/nickel transport system permease subunit
MLVSNQNPADRFGMTTIKVERIQNMILRIIGMGLLAAGVVFLVLGLQATDELGEEVARELTGEYSDDTQWKIIGGIVGIVIGGGLALFGHKIKRT